MGKPTIEPVVGRVQPTFSELSATRMTAAELTGAQRRSLRGLAHGLKPVVIVGRSGLTPTVSREVDLALDHHELIKVRIEGERDERARVADELEKKLACQTVGSIGKVLVLFRQHDDVAKRKIKV